jgi:hypothetical protein
MNVSSTDLKDHLRRRVAGLASLGKSLLQAVRDPSRPVRSSRFWCTGGARKNGARSPAWFIVRQPETQKVSGRLGRHPGRSSSSRGTESCWEGSTSGLPRRSPYCTRARYRRRSRKCRRSAMREGPVRHLARHCVHQHRHEERAGRSRTAPSRAPSIIGRTLLANGRKRAAKSGDGWLRYASTRIDVLWRSRYRVYTFLLRPRRTCSTTPPRAGVAQLDRAQAYEAWGRRFDSCHPRQSCDVDHRGEGRHDVRVFSADGARLDVLAGVS